MRKNPTSARKKGDKYQELWGVKLCGDWLLRPDIYQYIQFEAIPSETNQSEFYLDDLIVFRSDNKYDLYQTKHKQNSKDIWTWNELVKPLPKSKTSLLKKWSHSVFREKDKNNLGFYSKINDAIFITNADADEGIKKYLKDKFIDIEQLQSEDKELYNSIKKEIGNVKLTTLFFKKFKFNFNEKSENELENDIKNFYNDTIYVTDPGFDKFLKWIRNRALDQWTKEMTIEEIRKECEFDNPKPLNEDFIIPKDFEIFNDQIHQKIIQELRNKKGGIKVLYGEPGSGKSVYLSKLNKELNDLDIISIKHHYHLSPEDSNPMDRLNSSRIIEAVKAQFKSHKEDLDGLANINSKNQPLGKFITQIASSSLKKKKPLVIIIDGLDHPLKYDAEDELKSFLSEICLPQKGVWIVIGMQLIAKPYLPLVITEKCPEKEWIKVNGLSNVSIARIVKKNIISLKIPTDNRQFNDLINKIVEITKGNPLHLRYTLQQLKNQNKGSIVTEYSCKDLIPYGGDIEQYYNSLWAKISDVAKNILLTISSVNFHFTKKQLIECISQTKIDPSNITIGFDSVAHLISINYRNELSVYHNSFEVYLRNRSEYEQQKILLRTNIKRWLEQSSCEYLKWAELRLIEKDLGNNQPLLQIDRNWLIESICNASNPSQISFQLKKASSVAFEQNNFTKALKLSYLHTYYLNSEDFVEESTNLIWKESFYQNQNVFEHINFNEIPTKVLPDLVAIADSKGDVQSVKAILDVLIERQSKQEFQQGNIPPVTQSLLRTIPYDRKHLVTRIFKYIINFRDLNVSPLLFRTYASTLLHLGQKTKISQLLKNKLNLDERNQIFIEIAEYGLKNNSDDVSVYMNGCSDLPILCLIYLSLKGNNAFNLPKLPDHDIFPDSFREHDPEERNYWKNFYHNNFLLGILYSLNNKEKEVEKWIKDSNGNWSAESTKSLFNASLLISKRFKQSSISFKDLFLQFSNIKELKWPEDRDSLTIQHALSDSISLIIVDLLNFKLFFKDSLLFDISDYELICKTPYLYSKNDLLNLSLDFGEQIFDNDVYQKLRDENIKSLSESINYFSDRSENYIKITKLVRLYEDTNSAKTFLLKAVDNLLGYGYHKDMYLFEIIEAIDFCAKGGIDIKKINEWFNRIIPIIEYVGDYTDGDETNYLSEKLAALLSKWNKELFYKDLYWSVEKEDLYHAESLFNTLINSFTYTDDVEIAIASTALDQRSFSTLKEQSQSNSRAKMALDNIESYLGVIKYPTEDNGYHSPDITPKLFDYSKVKPNNLLSHLESNFDNKWQKMDYFGQWIKVWLKQYDKQKLYFFCKKIIEEYDVKDINGEIFDTLFPLAYEFDNGISFEFLVNAQINDHGWQLYWTDKKKAEKRWENVAKYFSKRYLEFFKKSTNESIPLSKGVEYFSTVFSDLKVSEEITEASIQFAEELMADLIFPSIDWQNDNEQIGKYDILLQRLLWPVTITQERAACSISLLLTKSSKKRLFFNKLLDWIKSQKMESIVAVGLLPIIKAFYTTEDKNELDYINYTNIENSIKINSVVIDELLIEISKLCKTTKRLSLEYVEIEDIPSGYNPTTFFTKYIRTFLAPIYMDRASKIERLSPKPFIKLWSYISDKIITEESVVVDANQGYFMSRSEYSDFVLGFSSKISQVYRSAFLRVLQHFYNEGYIPTDFFLEYAYATTPIDLSSWKISPNRCPDWWPEIKQVGDCEKTKKEINILSFKNPMENLCKPINGKFIIAAEGAIKPGEDWQSSSLSNSFNLIGFGYKVIGPELPTPEEVSKEILYSPIITRIPSITNKPIHFLEDQSSYISSEDEYLVIKDLVIFPLIARQIDLAINLWQYYRDCEVGINVTPYFSNNLNLKLANNSWFYKNNNGKKVIEFKDWLEGLRERYERTMPIHHGQYILSDKNFIEEWLAENDLKLGYLLVSEYKTKKYSYDKPQEFKETKLVNLSPIITSL